MKKPQDSSIAIIGAARNIGDFLPELISIFENCFGGFSERYYFIVENNSSDDTRNILLRLEKQYLRFYPLLIENNVEQIKYKTERIAIARNIALAQIKKDIPSVDYVAVVDLDAINLGLDRNSVESCWNYSNWDAMFANQPEGYYDIFALRHNIWSPRDYLKDFYELKNIFGEKIAIQLSLKSKIIKIPEKSNLIKVESAFGGVGIYKASNILSEEYVGLDIDGKPICEHLSVNLGIRNNGGSLFINPRMTNVRGYNVITRLKAIIYEKFIRDQKIFEID